MSMIIIKVSIVQYVIMILSNFSILLIVPLLCLINFVIKLRQICYQPCCIFINIFQYTRNWEPLLSTIVPTKENLYQKNQSQQKYFCHLMQKKEQNMNIYWSVEKKEIILKVGLVLVVLCAVNSILLIYQNTLMVISNRLFIL